jgi:uncharacterized protein with PIN domain
MSIKLSIIFAGDLAELLPGDIRGERQVFERTFPGRRSVKDLVQSLGVPHTEVGCIMVDGEAQDSSFLLIGGEQVEVFPASPASRRPFEEPLRLLCDVHLRKLARRLRLLGLDVSFNPDWDDARLAEISQQEKRILMSRDRGLLMRNQVEYGLLIRSNDPEEQVKEVFKRLEIRTEIQPFTRCLLCGGFLELVPMDTPLFKESLAPRIPPKVLEWCSEYNYCSACRQVFWKGSHHRRLLEKVSRYCEKI